MRSTRGRGRGSGVKWEKKKKDTTPATEESIPEEKKPLERVRVQPRRTASVDRKTYRSSSEGADSEAHYVDDLLEEKAEAPKTPPKKTSNHKIKESSMATRPGSDQPKADRVRTIQPGGDLRDALELLNKAISANEEARQAALLSVFKSNDSLLLAEANVLKLKETVTVAEECATCARDTHRHNHSILQRINQERGRLQLLYSTLAFTTPIESPEVAELASRVGSL